MTATRRKSGNSETATRRKGDVKEPHWLNLTNAAKASGVTVKTFYSWGIPHVADDGKQKFYLISDIVENRVKNALDKSRLSGGGMSSQEAKEAMDEAKLLEIQQRTENLAIKNSILRRETAPISSLTITLGSVCSQISAILESIPVNLKRVCPKLNANDIERIQAEIVKIQNIAGSTVIDVEEYNAD